MFFQVLLAASYCSIPEETPYLSHPPTASSCPWRLTREATYTGSSAVSVHMVDGGGWCFRVADIFVASGWGWGTADWMRSHHSQSRSRQMKPLYYNDKTLLLSRICLHRRLLLAGVWVEVAWLLWTSTRSRCPAPQLRPPSDLDPTLLLLWAMCW